MEKSVATILCTLDFENSLGDGFKVRDYATHQSVVRSAEAGGILTSHIETLLSRK